MSLEFRPVALDGGAFRLRPWRAGDVESLVRHANDESVSRGLRDRFPFPYSETDAHAWIEHAATGAECAWAIEIDGAAAGGIGLRAGADIYRHAAEIGYWLGRTYWNRGIVSAAVRTVVAFAFAEPELHRLHAQAFADNPASMRVLEKNGFRREGVLREAVLKRGRFVDTVAYARLRGDGAAS